MTTATIPNYKWQELANVIKQWKITSMEKITVNAYITPRSNYWSLQIVEEDPVRTSDSLRFDDTRLFDQSIKWTEAQLLNREDVGRKSYDMWYFGTKQEAEKFKTLFTLKWAR